MNNKFLISMVYLYFLSIKKLGSPLASLSYAARFVGTKNNKSRHPLSRSIRFYGDNYLALPFRVYVLFKEIA
ncbi:hypothetical protein [Vibrio pomeroyi]|uniref:hypothetical protein n=1 Tax=Vibrio pomeroyi TaxID=198832 RepID=UPI0021C30D14|nr:hypothetical protein [Vibrio pomeroyi]